jgi:pyruvate/2-oxoglutarate dehydrogenase complex dihydrolipoamide dehydrogenase (E3) component
LSYSHDVIVIGAGAGGLTAAGGCAMLGLRVALIERGEMGGDCLNTGCVPSKALIAAAHRAHDVRTAGRFGIMADKPKVDFQAVYDHVHAVIAAIAPVDSQERFEALGCEVIRGHATLTGKTSVSVNGRTLSAPRIVLAVGSRPAVPPIPGIEAVPYLTNETIFELTACPDHLMILGGGPIGMEMAQSFRRLGALITVIDIVQPLAKDDPEAADIGIKALQDEGVTIVQGRATGISQSRAGIAVTLEDGNAIIGSHLLVATGRSVNFDGLDLEAAGVGYDRSGIVVDARRRTSNRRIYAIGDCRPGPAFTHASGYEGGNIVLEIGLGLPTRVDYRALPWVTYLDPEIAQIGLTEADARKRHGDTISIWREDFADNDRAIAEGATKGFVKLVKKGPKLLGATIVGRHAGDLLLPYAMAITGKKSTFGIASLIVPYPNRSEHLKKAAYASHEAMVFNRFTRGWAQLLARSRR